jgi:hypothetical protein
MLALLSGVGSAWDHEWQESVAQVAWPDVQPSRTLALVRVDESTLLTHGEGKWPLSRLTYATALMALRSVSSRLAVLEMPMLPDGEERSVFDSAFVTQARRLNAVVIATTGLRTGQGENPGPGSVSPPMEPLPFTAPPGLLIPHFSAISPTPAALTEGTLSGLGNLPFDPKHGLVSIPLLCQINGTLYPSLLLRSLMAWDNVGPKEIRILSERTLAWTTSDGKKREIPLDRHGGVRPLRWRSQNTIPEISLDALVVAADPKASQMMQHPNLESWSGRAVWIIRSAPATWNPIPTQIGPLPPGDIWTAGWDAVLGGTLWHELPQTRGLIGCAIAGLLSAVLTGGCRPTGLRCLLLASGGLAIALLAYGAAWQLWSLPLIPWLVAWSLGSVLGWFSSQPSQPHWHPYEIPD